MAAPAFEVAEVFRRHGDAYRCDHAGISAASSAAS